MSNTLKEAKMPSLKDKILAEKVVVTKPKKEKPSKVLGVVKKIIKKK